MPANSGAITGTKAHKHSAPSADGGFLDDTVTGVTGTSNGSLIYFDGSSIVQNLPAGNLNEVLTMGASVPAWATSGGGGGQVCQTPLATAYTGLGGNGGAITRLGVKITNASHPIVGVPITDASFWLSKSGSPTGLGTVAIYNSVGVLQATSTTTLDWATLSGSLTKYTFGGFSYTVNNGDFIMVQGGSTGIGNEVSVGANENAGDIAYQCYAKYCDGSGTCGAAGFYEINSGTSDCHFCWDS